MSDLRPACLPARHVPDDIDSPSSAQKGKLQLRRHYAGSFSCLDCHRRSNKAPNIGPQALNVCIEGSFKGTRMTNGARRPLVSAVVLVVEQCHRSTRILFGQLRTNDETFLFRTFFRGKGLPDDT
jgi:hypothetical protein